MTDPLRLRLAVCDGSSARARFTCHSTDSLMATTNETSPPNRKKAIFLGLLMPLGSQGEVEDGKESGEIIFDVVSSFAIGYANAVVAVVIMIP